MINKKGQLIITWCANDVIDCAEQQGKKITISEAKEILMQMDRYHDCNIGISWDVINCHIGMYLDSQKIKKNKK